jgi:hypothetical protein
MRFLIILCCTVSTALILLVQPEPVQTVDTVAECIEKYWRGKPPEKWTAVEGMDRVCRSVMESATHSNW